MFIENHYQKGAKANNAQEREKDRAANGDAWRMWGRGGHISSEIKSKFCAQKQPKFVPRAPVASNAAGSSVAVSNDNYVRELYLSDPEVSAAGDLSQVSA